MKTIKTILLAAIAMMAYTNNIYAMENIKRATDATSKYSLIRNVDENTKIVYSYDAGQNSSSFLKITDNTSAFTRMFVTIDSVYDMEVFEDTLYFCGTKTINNNKVAVLGYFSISSFPVSVLEYITIPCMKRACKMEVCYMAGFKHVVMIGGTGGTNQDIVADVRRTGTSWEIKYSSDEIHRTVHFEDVTIINQHVVVASSQTSSNGKSVSLLFFSKPTTYGGSLFPQTNNVRYESIPKYFDGNILLETCENNRFVLAAVSKLALVIEESIIADDTVERDSSDVLLIKPVYVFHYVGKFYQGTVYFSSPSVNSVLNDLHYSPNNFLLGLLLYEAFNTSTQSLIYNLNNTMLNSPTITNCHTYNDVNITSMDAANTSLIHFTASGCQNAYPQKLYTFKFLSTAWSGCMPLYTQNVYTRIYQTDYTEIPFYLYEAYPTVIVEYPSTKNDVLTAVCG